MRKALLLILGFLLLCPICSYSQTYHVKRYHWAVGDTHGRKQKGGFDINVDFDNKRMSIERNDKTLDYTILDEHAQRWERNNLAFDGTIYCAIEENSNSDCKIYFRELKGEVVQIFVIERSGRWEYDVAH